MEWANVTSYEDGKVKLPDTWLFTHYFDALNVLFRVENALRLFVYIVMKDQYGTKWRDIELSSEEQGKTTIGALARRRIEQGRTFGYLTYPIQSPLMHLTSGELVGLITHDSYWPIFKDFFQAARPVVTLKLQEIGTVRNALAHFRPVSPNDVEIVKLNANQMLSRVEETLSELIKCAETVPTNTEDEWYKVLHTVDSDNVKIGFSQSREESWIRLTLRYASTVVSAVPRRKTYRLRYRLTTVDVPSILFTYHCLRNQVLFATESIRNVGVKDDLSLEMEKRIGLTFGRRSLSKNYAELKKCLDTLLTQVGKETELLREDQLARGKIVSATTVTAERQQGEPPWYHVPTDALKSAAPAEELPEYWGDIFSGYNFVSDTEYYPWMPVRICEQDIPF